MAVALNLAIAVVAAINTALACHLSLLPKQKPPNIEVRLILCVIVLFGAAVISGGSLILLSFNLGTVFAICVGVIFFSGVVISIHHVLTLFGFNWMRIMRSLKQLRFLSVCFSTLAFTLALTLQSDAIIWLTTLTYYFTLIYHSLVAIQNMPSLLWSRGSIIWAFTLCLSWILCSILSYVNNLGLDSFLELAFLLNGPEIIILASIGFVGIQKRQRQPQMNLAEA